MLSEIETIWAAAANAWRPSNKEHCPLSLVRLQHSPLLFPAQDERHFGLEKNWWKTEVEIGWPLAAVFWIICTEWVRKSRGHEQNSIKSSYLKTFLDVEISRVRKYKTDYKCCYSPSPIHLGVDCKLEWTTSLLLPTQSPKAYKTAPGPSKGPIKLVYWLVRVLPIGLDSSRYGLTTSLPCLPLTTL
jgi:hypothetical protein